MNLNFPQKHTPSCVFIGNIPYDIPDSDLTETLKIVGPFTHFRLKKDRKTG